MASPAHLAAGAVVREFAACGPPSCSSASGSTSLAGLLVAAFSHAYIWVHYFATEKPDMRRIYGGPA